MQPIVNGLEAEFEGKLVVVQRNATTAAGRAEMSYYQLPGHPSYVLVAPDGGVVWKGAGLLPENFLREQINKYATR